MSDIVTDLGTNYNWKAFKQGHNAFTITLLQSAVAFDISSYVFTLNIRKVGSTTNELSLTEGSGITNGGASGILSIALTQAQAGTTLKGDTYFWELSYVADSLTYRMFQGTLTLSNERNPSSSSTSLTANVSLAGTALTANITLTSSVTSSSIATALGAQTANTAYMGPASGASANPTFRTLVAADVPGSLVVFAEKTDSHTLVLTDTALAMNKATALNLTVPPNSSVAFPIGTVLYVKRTGVGILTIVAGVGVTVTGSSGGLTDPGQNVVMTLIKTGANTWDLQNGIAALTWTSFVPVATGFVAGYGASAEYVADGKKITVRLTLAGTSNLTTTTLTNLPFAAAVSSHHLAAISDNDVYAVGWATTAIGSVVLTIYPTVGFAGPWTASGGKRIFLTFTYQAQ